MYRSLAKHFFVLCLPALPYLACSPRVQSLSFLSSLFSPAPKPDPPALPSPAPPVRPFLCSLVLCFFFGWSPLVSTPAHAQRPRLLPDVPLSACLPTQPVELPLSISFAPVTWVGVISISCSAVLDIACIPYTPYSLKLCSSRIYGSLSPFLVHRDKYTICKKYFLKVGLSHS